MDTKQLDIGKCFNDAIAVYKVNFLMLVVSALLFQVISLVTLLIFACPIYGGYCVMLLKAMRKEDKKIELNDMFSMLKRFWPLVGLFFLQGLAIFAGFMLLIIPGIILTTMWLYSYLVMVDKNKNIMESLKDSWVIVKTKGFWMNLVLCIIYLTISGVTAQIPLVGWLINLLAIPFAILLIVSAYTQQFAVEVLVSTEDKPFADAVEEEPQA